MRTSALLTLSLIGSSALAVADEPSRRHGHHDAFRYRLQELTAVEGSLSSMNDAGVIAGDGFIDGQPSDSPIAYLWGKHRLIDLQTDPNVILATATEVNDRRVVVGAAVLLNEVATRGYVWKAGHVTILDDLPGGINVSAAEGSNNRGQVVGYADVDGGDECVLWESGTIMSLGDLPGGRTLCIAMDINDRGEIVGLGNTDGGYRAFVWREGLMKELPIPADATSSDATFISDTGVILGGFSNAEGTGGGLMWVDDEVRKIPVPSGFAAAAAEGLNDAGDMVGFATNGPQEPTQAFIWRNDVPYNLNDLIAPDDPLKSCVFLTGARAINDKGQIAAMGYNLCENRFANIYRLTPVKHCKGRR